MDSINRKQPEAERLKEMADDAGSFSLVTGAGLAQDGKILAASNAGPLAF